MIYLDNASTTKIKTEVLDTMLPYLSDNYGNPGGLYKFGRDARCAVEQARENVASFLHTTPDHILFTSGGSEGNNVILQSYRGSGIYSSAIEHDSVIKLLSDIGCAGIISPKANGEITSESVLRTIHECKRKPDIVSIMYVNNETGVKNNISMIAEEIKKEYHDCMFHSDCVQAAGNYEIDVDLLGLDFATISSHKIHGPKGVGAIYARDVSKIKPIIFGGSNQEYGKRAGTENVASIVGFGEACRISQDNIERSKQHYKRLWSCFIGTLICCIGADSFSINGSYSNESKTASFIFYDVDAQSLILSLDDAVCMSAGSACSSMENKPSRVLKAMGLSDDECMQSVRVSFSVMNNEREVIEAAKIIGDAVKHIRSR